MKDHNNKIKGMKNLAVGLGFFVSTFGVLCSIEIKNHDMEIKNHEVADMATKEVAGEDRTIDYKETRKALDALGYKNIIINDRERIYFKADGWNDYIEIYVGTQAPLPAFQDNRKVGSVKREELEKIILNAFKKQKLK